MAIPKDYFLAKLWALLHDPPDKTLDIETHKERARAYARRIINCTGYNFNSDVLDTYIPSFVNDSDRFASSLDRYIANFILSGGDYGRYKADLTKIVNIFNPEYEISFDSNAAKPNIETYRIKVIASLESLCEILDRLEGRELNIIYNVIYSLYEPVLIKFGVDTLPADTRVPTHTVLDHCYATAMVTNLLYGGKFSGYLVYIDIPGIHSYISKSRKLSDLWVSSYLLSAIAWYLVMELVVDLGGDIVVIPTLRFNPFYIHTIDTLLSKDNTIFMKEAGMIISDKLRKLYKRSLDGYPWRFGDIEIYSSCIPPKYAVMPSSITIFLPKIDEYLKEKFGDISEESIKKYFWDRLKKFWNNLWSKIYKDAERRRDDVLYILKSIEERGNDIIKSYMMEAMETPPFPLRIVVKDVGELYESFKNGGYKNYLPEDSRDVEYDEEVFDKLFYDYMMEILGKETSKLKRVKLDGYTVINIERYTEEAYLKGKPLTIPINVEDTNVPGLFRYCSVCSKLPAVVWMRLESDPTVIVKYGDSFGIKELDEDRLYPLIKKGESLCPYCLLKRILARYTTILYKTIYGELNGDYDKILSQQKFKGFKIPSHSEVTGYNFKKSLLEYLNSLPNNILEDRIRRVYQSLREFKVYYMHEAKSLYDILNILKRIDVDALPEDIKRLYHEVSKKISDEELRNALETIISSDTEEVFHERYFEELMGLGLIESWRKGTIIDIILKGLKAEGIKMPQLYYALLKMDGDNVGKAISGCIQKFSGVEIDNYLVNCLVDGIKKDFKKFLEMKDEGGGSKASKALMINKMIIDKVIHDNRLIVSPAFHVILSKAMIFSSYRDINNVRPYGYVVYAGGDDLLCILPVSKSLEVCRNSRDSYSAWSETHRGFIKLEGMNNQLGYYIAMPVTAGRSAAILYSHYLTPLIPVLDGVEAALKNISKKGKLLNVDGCELASKDILSIGYRTRSGGSSFAIIPLRRVLERKDKNIDLIHREVIDWMVDAYRSMESAETGVSLSQVHRIIKDEDRLKLYLKYSVGRGLVKELMISDYGSENKEHFAGLIDRIWFLSSFVIGVDDSNVYPIIELVKSVKMLNSAMREGS